MGGIGEGLHNGASGVGTTGTGIEIRIHLPGDDVSPFVEAGKELFRGDPAFIAPLDFELKERLDPAKNPFFLRAEVILFTAWRRGRCVGRCSAQLARAHLRQRLQTSVITAEGNRIGPRHWNLLWRGGGFGRAAAAWGALGMGVVAVPLVFWLRP